MGCCMTRRRWRISLDILMQTRLVIWMIAGQLQATYLNWVELLLVGEAKNNHVWHYLQLKQNTWHWQVQHKKLYGCNVFKMISMKPQFNQHSYMRITNPQYAWQKIHNIMDERNTLILSYIREQVEKKAIQLEYCESKKMVADMLTKALLSSQFVKLREMLGVRKIIEQVWLQVRMSVEIRFSQK